MNANQANAITTQPRATEESVNATINMTLKSKKGYPHLLHYLLWENYMCHLDGVALYDFDKGLTDKQIETLNFSIDDALAPERLHCDGEVSQHEAQQQYAYLMDVHRQLCKVVGKSLTLSND